MYIVEVHLDNEDQLKKFSDMINMYNRVNDNKIDVSRINEIKYAGPKDPCNNDKPIVR